MGKKTRTYAEIWADSINDTYTEDAEVDYVTDAALDGETYEDVAKRILTKAAKILRGYEVSATFRGAELDVVRHRMPAHEVHLSGSMHWVNARYGREDT